VSSCLKAGAHASQLNLSDLIRATGRRDTTRLHDIAANDTNCTVHPRDNTFGPFTRRTTGYRCGLRHAFAFYNNTARYRRENLLRTPQTCLRNVALPHNTCCCTAPNSSRSLRASPRLSAARLRPLGWQDAHRLTASPRAPHACRTSRSPATAAHICASLHTRASFSPHCATCALPPPRTLFCTSALCAVRRRAKIRYQAAGCRHAAHVTWHASFARCMTANKRREMRLAPSTIAAYRGARRAIAWKMAMAWRLKPLITRGRKQTARACAQTLVWRCARA